VTHDDLRDDSTLVLSNLHEYRHEEYIDWD